MSESDDYELLQEHIKRCINTENKNAMRFWSDKIGISCVNTESESFERCVSDGGSCVSSIVDKIDYEEARYAAQLRRRHKRLTSKKKRKRRSDFQRKWESAVQKINRNVEDKEKAEELIEVLRLLLKFGNRRESVIWIALQILQSQSESNEKPVESTTGVSKELPQSGAWFYNSKNNSKKGNRKCNRK